VFEWITVHELEFEATEMLGLALELDVEDVDSVLVGGGC